LLYCLLFSEKFLAISDSGAETSLSEKECRVAGSEKPFILKRQDSLFASLAKLDSLS